MEDLVPVSPDTPQDDVAKALSIYLGNQGLDSGMCGPTAIGVMGMMQAAIDADDLSVITSRVRADAVRYNEWIAEYHPTFEKHFVLED